MHSPIKPKIGRPITDTERDSIVEEIVNNLRPFKRGEKFAADQARLRIGSLSLDHPASKIPVKFPRPSDARKAHLKFRKSLTSLIAAWERLPPSAIQMLMHFAQIEEPLVRYIPVLQPKLDDDEKIIGYVETGIVKPEWESGKPVLLQQLKRLAAAAAGQTLGSSDGFHPDFSLTRVIAAQAYELMHEASKHPISGTAEGPYRTIASLMYKAISGKQIDSKRWCDAEIRRRGDHEKILRSLAGTEVLRS